jgi:putative Holliday junction resolvase
MAAPPPPTARKTPGRLLGFDFGERRIGVAVGNRYTGTAEPTTTLESRDGPDWAAIKQLLTDWEPEELVVGVPYNSDGSESDMTTRARRFARRLQGRFGLPVAEVDERNTSAAASALLKSQRQSGQRRRKVQKHDVDRWAAREILVSFLAHTKRSEESS